MSYIRRLRPLIGNELLLYPSVAAVIRDAEGRLLLQEKRSGEGWSLPAGGIEPGETPQEAVLREVAEETGFEARISTILGVFGGMDFRYTYPNGDRVEYVVTLFLCETTGRSSAPLDSETNSIRYFSEAEMPLLALPYPKNALFRAT